VQSTKETDVTVHLSPPEAESFTAAGNTFTILDDGGGTAGRLGLIMCELAPGWVGPPQHVHAATDETWFVLTGAARFTTGDESVVATAGRSVTAPRGTPHTFANADADAPATLFCTVSPADYVTYFRELAGLPLSVEGRFDPRDMRALMTRYDVRPYVA
jgi:mannose-6-phosphate isomerase-like protein (cupin superfamily)